MILIEENLLNLKDPRGYHCHIHHYHSRLSRLYVRAYRPNQTDPAFYVLFSDVGYIEGAISWQGADLCVAGYDDCISLLLAAGLIGEAIYQYPDVYAEVTRGAHLYVFRTPSAPVRLIASAATMLNDVPDSLR